jgi:hypothetical protein
MTWIWHECAAESNAAGLQIKNFFVPKPDALPGQAQGGVGRGQFAGLAEKLAGEAARRGQALGRPRCLVWVDHVNKNFEPRSDC